MQPTLARWQHIILSVYKIAMKTPINRRSQGCGFNQGMAIARKHETRLLLPQPHKRLTASQVVKAEALLAESEYGINK